VPIYLDKNSETLRLIQQLRDEAHRFGITFHRKLRSKNQTESELDAITGIGVATKTLLLKEFKSVKRIREADLEQLQKVVGVSKAEKIALFLHPIKEE
jgi:excinuclease ABC subunit C